MMQLQVAAASLGAHVFWASHAAAPVHPLLLKVPAAHEHSVGQHVGKKQEKV